MSECAVCLQPLAKPRYHYGGLSCYSCRAFFRRTYQRTELPVCKEQGACPMKQVADRKQCSACRYKCCLRAGMRTDLILDDDEKKTRFRKALEKKQAAQEVVNTSSERDEEGEGEGDGEERARAVTGVKQEQGPRMQPPDVPGSPRMMWPLSAGPRPMMGGLVARMGGPGPRQFYSRTPGPQHSPFPMSPRPQSFPDPRSTLSPLHPPASPLHFSPSPLTTHNSPHHPSQSPHIESQSPLHSPLQSPIHPSQSPLNPSQSPHPQSPLHPQSPQSPYHMAASPHRPYHHQHSVQSLPSPLASPYPSCSPLQRSNSAPLHPSSHYMSPQMQGPRQSYWQQPPRPPPYNHQPPTSYPGDMQGQYCGGPYRQEGPPTAPYIKEEPAEVPVEDVHSWQSIMAGNIQCEQLQPSTSKISYDRLHEAFGDVVRVKVEATEGENIQELINRYVHKKLRNQRRFSLKLNEFEREVGSEDLEMTEFLPPLKKRKSVIVRAGEVKSELPQDYNEDASGNSDTSKDAPSFIDFRDIDTTIGDIGDILEHINEDGDNFLLSAEIQPLLGNFDESKHLHKITDIFCEEWQLLNFGPTIMSEYIHFCEYKQEFPPAFFKSVNLTIRERCLAFISCLDELEQVSCQEQIFLFKRNLDNVEMLAYVFWFNRGTVDAETKFIFGSGDMEEWQARPESVAAVNLSTMISFMPVSEEEKFTLYTNFMKSSMAIMKDMVTFVLMILLVAFEGASEGSVAERLRKNFEKMIVGYWTEKKKAEGETEDVMEKVNECLVLLPQLARTFQIIKTTQKSNTPT